MLGFIFQYHGLHTWFFFNKTSRGGSILCETEKQLPVGRSGPLIGASFGKNQLVDAVIETISQCQSPHRQGMVGW